MEKLTSKGNLENVSAELDKLQKEVQEFAEKMEKKYDEKKMSAKEKEEMEEKADKIMKEEMQKCK